MSRKVMIVDDDLAIRLTVRAVLEPKGFEVHPVEDGEGCIKELEKGFKGVILMDIMMPGMSGWATVREINERGLNEGNLIAMLTAKLGYRVDSEFCDEGVFDYIGKPFEPKELATKVNQYCTFLAEAEEVLSCNKG